MSVVLVAPASSVLGRPRSIELSAVGGREVHSCPQTRLTSGGDSRVDRCWLSSSLYFIAYRIAKIATRHSHSSHALVCPLRLSFDVLIAHARCATWSLEASHVLVGGRVFV